jgi:hypothetical protein
VRFFFPINFIFIFFILLVQPLACLFNCLCPLFSLEKIPFFTSSFSVPYVSSEPSQKTTGPFIMEMCYDTKVTFCTLSVLTRYHS